MTEVNTTDIMLELYSILLMVINAPLLGDRQCQLPVRVVPLGGCPGPLLREERGTRRARVCSLLSHPSAETGGEEVRREGGYSALRLSLLASEWVLETEARAANVYRATSRRHRGLMFMSDLQDDTQGTHPLEENGNKFRQTCMEMVPVGLGKKPTFMCEP